MRTREEQISALAFEIDGVQAKESTKRYVEQHLIEAERRAEQRARAEIARDSERLDWLSGTVQEIRRVSNRPTQWVLEFSIPLRSLDHDDLRQAIDAAREVG